MMESIEYRIRNFYADEYLSGWTLVEEKLGVGSQGNSLVMKFTKPDGEVRALKVVQILTPQLGEKKDINPEHLESMKELYLNEITAMETLKDEERIMNFEWATVREWEGEGYVGCDLLICMPYKQCLRPSPGKKRLHETCQTAAQIGKDICAALMKCHAAGIIHRDIKPSNIFIERQDGETRYLLGDFGIAKITSGIDLTASTMGRYTILYAAPEQYSAKTPDEKLKYTEKVDIYCLGLTLYELCNDGCLPFSDRFPPNEEAVIKRLDGKTLLPRPSMAKKALSAVILKACAYNPMRRYQSAEKFFDALDALSPEDLQPRPDDDIEEFTEEPPFDEDYAPPPVSEQETRPKDDPNGTRPAEEGYGWRPQNAPQGPPPTTETPPEVTELPPLKKALVWMKARQKQLILGASGALALIAVIAAANWLLSVGGPPDIPEESISVALDETYQIALKPEGKKVSWSSEDEAIASVDENGLITAHGKGDAVITAKDPLGREDACLVHVGNHVMTLTVTPGECEMDAGNTLQLSAEIFPQDAITDALLWRSSRPEIVSVTQDGLLTANAAGDATITVSGGKSRAECDVKVWPVVTGVALSAPALEIEQGKSETLKAVLSPQEANGRDVTWSSSDENVALVEPSGKVTGRQSGTVVITASSGGQSAECTVTVTVPVESVTIKPQKLELKPGERGKLTAEITPKNATNQTVEWSSSNTSATTVDASGNVTAVAKGNSTIEATCGGKRATCSVSVISDTDSTTGRTSGAGTSSHSGTSSNSTTNKTSNSETSNSTTSKTSESPVVKATDVTLKPSELWLKAHESKTIAATVSPSNASDKTVAWSTDNRDVATVSQSGVVTAGDRSGSANITASCGGVDRVCIVHVTVPATGVSVEPSNLTLREGESATVQAKVTPETASDKTLTWSSNREGVAKVSQSGQITAIAPGDAVITASCGGVSVQCNVTVKPAQEVVSVDILDETGERALDAVLIVGETMSLRALINPADASDQTVQWISSNPGAVQVNNGLVTAVREGISDIIATCGGKSASVRIIAAYLIVETEKETDLPTPNPEESQPTFQPEESQPTFQPEEVPWEDNPEEIQPTPDPEEIPWGDEPTDPGEIWIH